MYTEPKIVTADVLSHRSYIEFKVDGNRFREYNGNRLELKIFPNRATSLKEKNRLLAKLLFEFKKKLAEGWNPMYPAEKAVDISPTVEPPKSIAQLFREVEAEKCTSPLSDRYKRELKIISRQFVEYLTEQEKRSTIQQLAPLRIEGFLNQFKSSGTYYMNKRRTLGVYFSEFVRKKYIPENLIKGTPRAKAKATLHKIYTQEQLKQVLGYLKTYNHNLYICCLLSYACLLRPHQEIRFLRKKHFNEDITTIALSGTENKSARVRVVGIPTYVKAEIRERLQQIDDPETNIFSLTSKPYGEHYFNKLWTRGREDMVNRGILQPLQSIYSFRHTSSVDIYSRTKDLHILQQLLGHSTMVVTLKYLRGLGEMNSQQLKDVLPVLELH